MKKGLLSIFAVIVFVIAANAQTEKGSIMAGGNFSLDFDKAKYKSGSTSVDGEKTTTLTINPVGGYFIMDGLAVGADLTIETSKDKYENDDEFGYTHIALGPFVKYYHSSGFFGLGSFGLGSAKSKSTDAASGITSETTYGVSAWRLGAGYAIFLNDNVSLEPMLSYGSTSLKNKDADPEQKSISSGLSISVGFQIFLN